jgi:hypothetical protein
MAGVLMAANVEVVVGMGIYLDCPLTRSRIVFAEWHEWHSACKFSAVSAPPSRFRFT